MHLSSHLGRHNGRATPMVRFFLLSIVLALCPNVFAAEKDKDTELKEIRARIENMRRDIEADTQRRNAMAQELKETELAVQSAREKVAEIRSQRLASEKHLADLKREQAETERRIAVERDTLAKELRAAYVSGREEQLILLLNQKNPADLGRMSIYYGYFARARAQRIATITDRLAHLDLLTERVAAEGRRLSEIEESHARQTQELGQARTNRARTLAVIQSKIRTRSDQVANLELQARALRRLIDELQRTTRDLSALPTRGFGRTQGKLPWPVTGKVLANYGESRAGGPLKWEGMLIGAAPGTQVRAIFHGRVVYADYLYGMGLMVAIDHGDGYTSFYGHQEQLYRKFGDTVAPGDLLGVLADQGGTDSPRGELHLEIRKGTQALDPRKWLRKQ